MTFFENLNKFAAVEGKVITSELKSDLDIFHKVQETVETVSDGKIGQKIDEVPPPGIKHVQQAIKLLTHFYESQDTDTTIFKFIGQIENDKECRNIFFSEYDFLAIISC